MNLSISFSGGKTSGFMTKWTLENMREQFDDVVVTFANTGQEHEETLKFVDRCDKEFGFNVVWLEAVVDPRLNKGTRHKIVTFETASRNGAPYEAGCAKYGLPNRVFQWCTRELKVNAMKSYLRSIGWKKGTYKTAIGVRVDEMDRVNSKMEEEGIIYPLIENCRMTKKDVNLWWAQQSFNLEIPEHLGNCTWCWKKSDRKLMTLALDHPEVFEFPARMEPKYEFAGAGDEKPRRFFRGKRTVDEVFARALTEPFEKFVPEVYLPYDENLDPANGCSESCEVY
jgi:hypothetical protein